jgi:hypothetical protein
LVDVLDEETVFEPPLVLEDDSLVTSPYAAMLQVEAPTTIFEPPKPRKRLASGSGLHHHADVRARQRHPDTHAQRRHDERLEERFERMDASMRRLEQQELDRSYEAAMRQFR